MLFKKPSSSLLAIVIRCHGVVRLHVIRILPIGCYEKQCKLTGSPLQLYQSRHSNHTFRLPSKGEKVLKEILFLSKELNCKTLMIVQTMINSTSVNREG